MQGDSFDAVEWATAEASRLRHAAELPFHHSTAAGTRKGSGHTPPARSAQAEASSAIEFLRRRAGAESDLYRAAIDGLDGTTASRYLLALAGILDQYVAGAKSGLLSSVSFEVASRVEAADDLMEQVAQLLADSKVHVAAPVVLAGAALEEMLRSMWLLNGELELVGKPGINTYATALKSANHLTRGEVKDIAAWADQRNDAAHGHFDALDVQRARLMADGINLFMQRRRPSSG